MNKLRIDDIHVENGTRLLFSYTVTGEWEKCFTSRRTSFIEYDIDISEVPVPVLAVPFVGNALPAAFVCDAVIEAESLDKDLADSVDAIREGFSRMFPMMKLGGAVEASKTISAEHRDRNGAACFFSGGLDANTTLLRHLEEKPSLISIWGVDVKTDDPEGWSRSGSFIGKTAEQFGIMSHMVKSDFREVFSEPELDQYILATGDRWWHGFQNGIAVITHAAPMAYVFGWDKVYFASTYSADMVGHYTCGSDPLIDNNIHFAGCSVVHDAFELNRQQKTEFVVNKCKESGRPVHIRVCWESRGGNNCCRCEKCYYTILGLIAEGADPNEFGFTWDKDAIARCRKDLTRKITMEEYYFRPVQKRMNENKAKIKDIGDYQWFLDLDIADANKALYKRFRNSRLHDLFN